MVRGAQDAVHQRIAQVQVWRRHVDLGAQRARAVRKFAGAHALEQVEVLFDAAIAIGAFFAGLGERSAILANFFGAQVADVGLALLDQLDRPIEELVEVVGGVIEAVPLVAQPVHVANDGVDVLLLFLLGIGVVEAQVGLAAEFRSQAKVQIGGLGVAEVQIAVGLGRKAGLHASGELVGLEVGNNDVADEIRSFGCFRRRLGGRLHLGIGWIHDFLVSSERTGTAERSKRQPVKGLFYCVS